MIKAWSFSRLVVFEQCKMRAKLAFIDKIPEPERPLPKGKTEHANDRGTRIHDAAELFVKSPTGIELIPELSKFEAEFRKLRELYTQGRVSLEGEWAVDKNWEPCSYYSETTWGRIKLDAMALMTEDHAAVIDYKSGKRFGNEIKHGEQGQLYAIGTFLRFPEIQKITVEFWYIDVDEMSTTTYTRKQAMKMLDTFDKRCNRVTDCEEFPPNPNIYSCKYCPYGPSGTGHCEKGV
jgi:hypothetical protein